MLTGTEQFYGALCIDIDMIQGYFKTEENRELLGPTIYNTPMIMQLGNELSQTHLGESLLLTEVRAWEIEEPKELQVYGKIKLNKANIEISAETNNVNYRDYAGQSGIIFKDFSGMQRAFFIFESLGFEKLDNFYVSKPFQFCIFARQQVIENI